MDPSWEVRPARGPSARSARRRSRGACPIGAVRYPSGVARFVGRPGSAAVPDQSFVDIDAVRLPPTDRPYPPSRPLRCVNSLCRKGARAAPLAIAGWQRPASVDQRARLCAHDVRARAGTPLWCLKHGRRLILRRCDCQNRLCQTNSSLASPLEPWAARWILGQCRYRR